MYADIMVKIDNQNNLLRSQLQVIVTLNLQYNAKIFHLNEYDLGSTSSRRTGTAPEDTGSN